MFTVKKERVQNGYVNELVIKSTSDKKDFILAITIKQ